MIMEDRFRGETLLEIIERKFFIFTPPPFLILSCQAIQRSCDFGKVLDKAAIKVGKTKEGLDFFDLFGARPILNTFDFLRIHSNAFFRDDKTKEFYFFLFEKAFLRFKEEIVLVQSF